VQQESTESQRRVKKAVVHARWVKVRESRNGPDFHPTVWLGAHPCETAIKNRIELLTSHHVATLSPKPDMTWKTGPLSLRCVHMKTRRSSLWWETKQFQNTILGYLEISWKTYSCYVFYVISILLNPYPSVVLGFAGLGGAFPKSSTTWLGSFSACTVNDEWMTEVAWHHYDGTIRHATHCGVRGHSTGCCSMRFYVYWYIYIYIHILI
jgi:hypothetical protein